MSEDTQSIQVERIVNVPVAQVYWAITNATSLREWLCDVATVDPRPGGRLYLWWNAGYYACGEFTAVEPERAVAFTWHGRGEPGATQVQITLQAKGDATLVTLVHSGIGMIVEWKDTAHEIQKEWVNSVENLASVLETGLDLRLVRRPMLGILLSDFNAEIAAQMGVPVAEGVRLDGVVDGLGAQAAGLQKDDVVVGLGGSPVTGFNNLTTGLQGKRAGDTVDVLIYRGSEKKTIPMKLSSRPLPEIPFDALELSKKAAENLDRDLRDLAACFEGASEAECSRPPAPGEWSAKEVLAHLLQGERGGLLFNIELVSGHERWADGFGRNTAEQIQATLAAYPTAPDLLAGLKCACNETVAYLAALPAEFVARKGSFWRLAYGVYSGISHVQGHLDQIRAAIKAARE